MTTPADAIRGYVLAKDGNRPCLLDAAFEETAALRMHLRTDAIAFPALSDGRAAIADAFVRRFNQTYENVWTFCVGAPPADDAAEFACDWFVAMTEKAGGALRFGCGGYGWTFAPDGRIRTMRIEIDAMVTLAPTAAAPMLAWARSLPYPWCPREALAGFPRAAVSGVDAVLARLATGSSGS